MFRELVLDANKSLEASPKGTNLGSCHESVSSSDGNLGSPCFSVHHLDELGNNMGGDDATFYNEIEENVCKKTETIFLYTEEEYVDSDHRDLIVADDPHSPSSNIDVIGKEVTVRVEEEVAT